MLSEPVRSAALRRSGDRGLAAAGRLKIMAAKKKGSGIGTLITGVGFVFAVILVLHIISVLFKIPAENGFIDSVHQAAEPLALFFPGLVQTGNSQLQVLVDYGLAAGFWVLVTSLLARAFG